MTKLKPCRNGLVRNSVKFGDNRCRKSTTGAKAAIVHNKKVMTKAAIVAQFPKFTAATWTYDNIIDPDSGKINVGKAFGKAATKLTRTLAKKLEGKRVYMLWGWQMDYFKKPEQRVSKLTLLRIPETEYDEDEIRAEVIPAGKKRWQDAYMYYSPYDMETVVTGGDQDPVYVFL